MAELWTATLLRNTSNTANKESEKNSGSSIRMGVVVEYQKARRRVGRTKEDATTLVQVLLMGVTSRYNLLIDKFASGHQTKYAQDM